MNIFDQNFMKLCLIVKYHVFFKFDNGLYHMAPCFKELLPLVYEIHWLKRRLLSNINSFDYKSMKLGHIVKYHNVFKFQNGPYPIMPSGVIALC